MKLIERIEMLDPSERLQFWQFVESIKWLPGANCKKRLLRDLSPSQAANYKHVLDYICEVYAEELSTNFNFNKIFEAKAYCSNIVGQYSYESIAMLTKDAENAVSEINSQSFSDLDDIFLLMIPDDDDYWSE